MARTRTSRSRRKKAARPPKPANDHAAHGGPYGRRPVWQGHLRLSLVSCPVALFSAIDRQSDISFHLINPETSNRIRMVPTDPDSGPVERGDLVKGYETSKDHYILLDDDDLDAVKLETTRTLDIERFVAADEIDRLYWNDPYFLIPDGDEGTEAYAVIRDAMAGADKMALGRLVMHTRERVMALEPRGRGLLAYSLRARNEVRDADEAFADVPTAKPDKKMIDIAEKIIAQQEGPFDPDEFTDRYEAALRDLIHRKQKGQKTTVAAPPPDDTNVIDLMAALKKSLAKKGAARPRKAKASARKRARRS